MQRLHHRLHHDLYQRKIQCMNRTYARNTPELEQALAAAPEAQLVEEDASQAERVTAWVEYGYHRWQGDQLRQAKIEAYRQIASEEGRSEDIRASLAAAVAEGIL